MSIQGGAGIKYNPTKHIKYFQPKYFGEIRLAKEKKTIIRSQVDEFYNQDPTAPHVELLGKQTEMVKWQLKNSLGYLGSVLSTFRHFPLSHMDELYAAVGRHNRYGAFIN